MPSSRSPSSLLELADTAIEKSWYHGVDGLGDIDRGVRAESEPRSIPSWSPTRVVLRRSSMFDEMNELIFLVEEAPEGGFTARALGASIFTEANDWDELQSQVRDAVLCHFEEGRRPKVVRLHYVREDVFAV